MTRSFSDKDPRKEAPTGPLPPRGTPEPPSTRSTGLPPPTPPPSTRGSYFPPSQSGPRPARSSSFPQEMRPRREWPSNLPSPRSNLPRQDPFVRRDPPSTPTLPRSNPLPQEPTGGWDSSEGSSAARPTQRPVEPTAARASEWLRHDDPTSLSQRGQAPGSAGRRASASASLTPARPMGREPPSLPQRHQEASATGHDPYTPIHQILGYTRLLMAALQGNVAPQHIQDIRHIEDASRKLLGIVQAMEGGDDEPLSTRQNVPSSYEELAARPEPEGGGLASILVVDDSRGNRDVLCRMLHNNGYRTTAAEDGPRALALAARERFDAVLLDVNMPGISGLGVLSALRQSRSSAELPVIMVTTRGASEDVVEALKLGANDHVTKPVDFDILLGRLDTQLTLKRSREQLSQLAAELSVKSEFIRKTFGRYLSDDVVNRLLSSPEAQLLGGEEREVTILMTDLRSFTTMTEHMPPELVMRLLNGYLGEMARIIVARGGTIVEFIGDAILALFGAPFAAVDDARRAIACALEMQIAMDAVNDKNSAEGLPVLQMGIALNTGTVVVGNIGSEARTKYGVVGAQVNLTSRIESCTVGRQILIAESTRRNAGSNIVLGQSHKLTVKGFTSSVLVHEVTGLDSPERIHLPERRVNLVPLSSPLPVVCARINGKQVEGEPQSALLIELSPFGATLRLDPRPAPFTNLQLHLPGALAELINGELYAKVTELDARAGDLARIRFTSSPSGLVAVTQELLRMETTQGDGAPPDTHRTPEAE